MRWVVKMVSVLLTTEPLSAGIKGYPIHLFSNCVCVCASTVRWVVKMVSVLLTTEPLSAGIKGYPIHLFINCVCVCV